MLLQFYIFDTNRTRAPQRYLELYSKLQQPDRALLKTWDTSLDEYGGF